MNQRLLEGKRNAGLAVEGQCLISRLPTNGAVNRRWPVPHQGDGTSGEQEWSSGGGGDWPDLSPPLTVNVTPSTDSGFFFFFNCGKIYNIKFTILTIEKFIFH